MIRDLVLAVDKVCEAAGVDPDDFTRHFDPTVSINVHQRYIIVDLSDS
jgi:hypothetical protein